MGKTAAGMRSGELAKAAGVSADTLRHYEKLGLLAEPSRRANGYRVYPPAALARVRLIQGGLAIGFTLAELATFLGLRDSGGAPCRRVRAAAGERLAEVESRIDELCRFRDDLRRTLGEWDRRLGSAADGRPVHLLERLEIAVERPSRRAAVAATRFSRASGAKKEKP
jgi:DNA-binding transcriptional MerR regulator